MKTIIQKSLHQRPLSTLSSRLKHALLIFGAVTLIAPSAGAMDNFNQAKKVLPSIYKELSNPTTIYCGCPLSIERNRLRLDLRACGYKVRKQAKRAARVEYEHVMPAWEFGHQLKCWQDGGRKRCTSGKNGDTKFKQMEGDLHNLFPSVGEVNGDRANFRFSEWNAVPTQYGQCEMVVDFKGRRAQPPKRSRGMIARAYLYMADKYGIRLSQAQSRLYQVWNRQYAPDDNECLRNELIAKVQGNDNPFVTKACALRK